MNPRHSYQTSDKARKPLSPENKALQKEKASCYMTVKFHDGNTWSKWSNEYKQPTIRNISDAINIMFQIVQKWGNNVASAAIFDTRADKRYGAHNKIYQYEKRVWKMEQPFTW
jgi:hypothetical protein